MPLVHVDAVLLHHRVFLDCFFVLLGEAEGFVFLDRIQDGLILPLEVGEQMGVIVLHVVEQVEQGTLGNLVFFQIVT